MKLIAAVDRNWAIGYKGELLVSIRADQQNFRKLTLGKTVVLGRKTMDTFPGGRPLKNRRNIILTRDTSYSVPDAETVHSIDELLELLKDVDTDDVYIIGGSSVYAQMLPYCNEAVITEIDYRYEADSYFPNLDESPEWEMVEESEEQTCYDIIYTFCRYIRKDRADEA